ncbi:DUF2236 domain-containing protein [Nocardioides immobilis]|uniref:DUF2236 domain-containing protein n=1 Tax=Nocardioides immobilis TaxID=2049295 RepID=A0A417XZ55_9ACTN|nr:oxygenase MpaB family protein [Nocardioides immobilis]RHW25646.1 DUF2236 domain-containing protein [Nocardioides immobilis]
MTTTSAPTTDGFPPVRADERPDLLAPGSPAHRVLAEPLIALYGLPGFLLPLMHPATAEATLRRDPVFTNPDSHLMHFAARLRDTIEMIAGVGLAGEEADHVAFAMRELHKPIKGRDTRGEPYHAWTRDIWTWNWAAIVAGFMSMYGGVRGFPSREFRDDAYLGLVETGRRFGVLGMPASYDEFLVVWPLERDRIADPDNETIQRVLALTQARGLPAPTWLRRLPLPLWAVATLPIRHFLRMSLLLGLSPEERAMLGFRERPTDRAAARLHRLVWRIGLPRPVSYRLGLAWMAGRSRWGQPVWRTRFSAAALGADRG